MRKLWLFSMIWVAISSFVFGWVRHADAHGENDTQRLLETIQPYVAGTQKITLKYTGYYGACGASEDVLLHTGRELSAAFGVPAEQQLRESNGHPVYSSDASVLEHANVTLTVAEPQESSACYAVLRLEASSDESLNEIMDWQEQANKQLNELSIKGQWNVMVQGAANEQELANASDSQMCVQRVADAFKGTVEETYSDEGTISVSVASAGFHSSIASGSHSIELQIALHRDSVTGVWRLTAGTPIITSEY